MQRRPTDLAELVREAVIPLADEIAATGLELQVDLAEELPPAGVDPALLHRAIGNLLGNARRHAAGATRLQVRLEASDTGAAVSVADNGSGLGPAGGVLFQLYTRVCGWKSARHAVNLPGCRASFLWEER